MYKIGSEFTCKDYNNIGAHLKVKQCQWLLIKKTSDLTECHMTRSKPT